MKINIKQMAVKAGVSVATISRVINPETIHKVAPATREKIEALVKKLNYTPNLAGRNLRQTATKNIGLIIPYFKDLFYSFYYTHILSGVAESLASTDYRLKILIIDHYGHFLGARQAVDEYFLQHNITMLMNRVDYTGIIGIKN